MLCLAFPLEPPPDAGKPQQSRLAELDAVAVAMLVVQGKRNRFGMLPPGSSRRVAKVPGDHGLNADLEAVAAGVRTWLFRRPSRDGVRRVAARLSLLTRARPPPRLPPVLGPDAAASAGRIAFRLRLGVTGHTNGLRPEHLDLLSEQIRRVRGLLRETEATPVGLTVVSALAEGADRVVAEQVFEEAAGRGEAARLEAVLPFGKHRYAEKQGFAEESRAEFERWLAQATSVLELDLPWGQDVSYWAYEVAGRHVVTRCDVLLALWNGQPGRGRGGTAATLLYAAEIAKPCIWIATAGEARISDNLKPGSARDFRDDVRRRAALPAKRRTGEAADELPHDVLEPLVESFKALDAFNSEALPRTSDQALRADEPSEWVEKPFLRATGLAQRYQRLFFRATWLMSVLAVAAAACLGVGVAEESPAWAWPEVACLLALASVFGAVHFAKLHKRWLSYRLLAERLRSARYLAPTGVDFRGTAGLEAVFVERRSADWVLRAFEEVWDSRPHAADGAGPRSDEEVESLRRSLAVDWIGGQIGFHKRMRDLHERRNRWLTSIVLLLFVGTVVFAILHGRDGRGLLEDLSTALSIVLPAAGASLGAVLTVRQHRALAERSRRMHSDLVSVQRSLLDTPPRLLAETRMLAKASSEAARLIAEEAGDWLGAMWFLDIEHPP